MSRAGGVPASTWNRKLGWVVPSWNTVTEYEVARMTAPDTSNHFTRITHTADTEEAFAHMVREAPDAVELLSHAGVDAICFACTAASFFRGRDADLDLGAELQDRAKRPVVTMADAIVRSARHLGLERLSVAAPYERWLLDLLVSYLGEAGFEVVASAALGEQADVEHGLDTTIGLARRAAHPDADGLVISCGNFRTLEVIGTIEEELGIPTISSIQAAVWAIHETIGADARISGASSLFSTGDREPTSEPLRRV